MSAGILERTIVVERTRSALVARSVDADAAGVGFVASLPVEPARTTIVVDGSAAEALGDLDDGLIRQLRGAALADASARARTPEWEIRLVAARAGRPGASGGAPLAARLAERLGMGVVAPDGELIVLCGGELFSAGPGAGWIGFRHGRAPEWSGPRYPIPAWQTALPRERPSRKPGGLARLRCRRRRSSPVTVTAIPAGLWVRTAGSRRLPLADLGFGVPVEPGRPVVLVGAPGEGVPGTDELAEFLASLPVNVREAAVLAPYGQDPGSFSAVAQSLADRLALPLRAYHALPHYASDGTRRFAVFAAGEPERAGEAAESMYLPGHRTQPAGTSSWSPPPKDAQGEASSPWEDHAREFSSRGIPRSAPRAEGAVLAAPRAEAAVVSPPRDGRRAGAPMVTVDAGGTVRPSRRIGRPLGLVAEVTLPDVPPVVNTAVSPEPVADRRTATATTLSPAEATLDDLDPATYVIADLTSFATSATVPSAPPATADTTAATAVAETVAETVTAPEALAGDYDRHWLAQRTSTPEDRHAFRGSLGWRYDAAVRSVARLMAEQPGLRGGGETDEASMTDLAAVRVFATGDHAEFVASIRAGGSQDDRPFAACLASGLRMLPALQGVVVRGGPPDPAAADAYRPGQELVEAAPLIALDAVDAQVSGALEVLIWSATARRLSGFAEMDVSQVAFLPGTVFRVLAVAPADTSSPVRRVLLAEVSGGRTRAEWVERVLARLEEAAAARAALGPAADDPTGRFAALPGDPARARVAPIG